MEQLSSFKVRYTLVGDGGGTGEIAIDNNKDVYYQHHTTAAGESDLLVRGSGNYQRGAIVAQSMGDPNFWDMPPGSDFNNTWIPVPPGGDPLTELVSSDPLFVLMLYRDSFVNVSEGPSTSVEGRQGNTFYADVDSSRLLAELSARAPEVASGATVEDMANMYPLTVEIVVGDDGLVYQTRGTSVGGIIAGESTNIFYDFDEPIEYPEPVPSFNPWN
ncbi:hypothetical protein [Mycolicibacterium sp. S3B2]|uniref:hypothetical protein n=1 Tax=Mycolicibacterium sp. S3B2 TaxID=3415120 RepID=UPI003C7CC4AF